MRQLYVHYNCFRMCIYMSSIDPGAMFNASCSESGDQGLEPRYAIQESKKKNLPCSFVKIQYCGETPWPQTARARISNYVSGGQCLIFVCSPLTH